MDRFCQLVHAFSRLLRGAEAEGEMHHQFPEQLAGADPQSAAVVKAHLCAPLPDGTEQALQLAALVQPHIGEKIDPLGAALIAQFKVLHQADHLRRKPVNVQGHTEDQRFRVLQ